MKRFNSGLWVIVFFVFMIFCFSFAYSAYDSLTDGQIKLQNNWNTAFENSGTAMLIVTFSYLDSDTLNVTEEFTVADTATFTVSCDATFATNLSVGDSVYVDTVLVVGNDAVITDSLYIGGNCVVVGIISAEHLTSSDDADIADSLYVGGNIVGADSIIVTNTVSAEHLYSTDDLAVADDADVVGDLTAGTIASDGALSGTTITGSAKLDIDQAVSGGASVGNIIKLNLAAAESYSGTTAGLTIKNYMADNTAAITGGEFTGLSLYVKGFDGTMSGGSESSLMSIHSHSSSTLKWGHGMVMYADSLGSWLALRAATVDYGLDFADRDNVTVNNAEIRGAYGETIDNTTDGEWDFGSANLATTGDMALDSLYAGSDVVAIATVQAEHLYSTDDAVIADSTYIGGNLGAIGTIDGATVNTGQGDNELYDMDQNVLTTSDVVFDSLYTSGNIISADSVIVTNTVSAEHLYSSDDAAITDDLSVGGETTLSGGMIFNVTTVEDSVYTVLVSDYIIDISHTDTDTVDVTIPDALITAGKRFEIWDTEFNADTNSIIIAPEGVLINEAAADTIAVAGGKRLIWSDGTNWFSRE